jgi:hypothetical protein
MPARALAEPRDAAEPRSLVVPTCSEAKTVGVVVRETPEDSDRADHICCRQWQRPVIWRAVLRRDIRLKPVIDLTNVIGESMDKPKHLACRVADIAEHGNTQRIVLGGTSGLTASISFVLSVIPMKCSTAFLHWPGRRGLPQVLISQRRFSRSNGPLPG